MRASSSNPLGGAAELASLDLPRKAETPAPSSMLTWILGPPPLPALGGG